MQCKNCDKAFDTSYIPPGAPLLCTYCGHDNTGVDAQSAGDTFTEPTQPTTPFSETQTKASAVDSGDMPPLPPLPPVPPSSGSQGGGGESHLRVVSEWEAGWKVNPFKAYVDTFKKVVLEPTSYFATITPIKDYAAIFVLLYVNLFIALFAGVLWGQLFNFSLLKILSQQPELFYERTSLIGELCGAFFGPLLFIVIIFVMAGIHHFFLRTVAGSKKDFDSTITIYTLGSVVYVFKIVPVLGDLAVFVYKIILTIFGMADMHEVPQSKAFLAWVFPVLICCCCYFGTVIFFISVVAGFISAAGH